MLTTQVLRELHTAWFPNMTDAGLARIIELLEQGSPLLIHGCFTRATPMGCLATHAAWHHPRTAHLTQEAGIAWLTRVARLNPATSAVILDWDSVGANAWEWRDELLREFRAERRRRESPAVTPPEVPVSLCEAASG
jgi:hypothetical protein